MAFQLYDNETPLGVKNANGLHMITENTPNGQKVQIFLEELADAYGMEWTTTLMSNPNHYRQYSITSISIDGDFSRTPLPIEV
ncbi:hypothetical protein G7Z17_g3527 [Cylindrodendrum hubeiense]|uniref:Uncharacterized protein n=1 Tax=Cylindrodendrum hubeiense TaxID=595255 RepID=A0A9P5HAM7_9HYPO|nr:hypothetical protein G7Z17_g3527 [Cylindrodendrum hubeiense]